VWRYKTTTMTNTHISSSLTSGSYFSSLVGSCPSLETSLHVLNEGDGIQEFALALGTLLNPSLLPILLTLLDTVDVVLKGRDDFGAISIARKLSLTTTAVNSAIKLGVVDNGKEDGVWHPLRFLG